MLKKLSRHQKLTCEYTPNHRLRNRAETYIYVCIAAYAI